MKKDLELYGLNVKDAQDCDKWKRCCNWPIFVSREEVPSPHEQMDDDDSKFATGIPSLF